MNEGIKPFPHSFSYYEMMQLNFKVLLARLIRKSGSFRN